MHFRWQNADRTVCGLDLLHADWFTERSPRKWRLTCRRCLRARQIPNSTRRAAAPKNKETPDGR